MKEKIPGYDFETLHMPIYHHSDLCIAGDIFEHPNAKHYSEIYKIKRKFVTKESEMNLDTDENMTEGDNDFDPEKEMEEEADDPYNSDYKYDDEAAGDDFHMNDGFNF